MVLQHILLFKLVMLIFYVQLTYGVFTLLPVFEYGFYNNPLYFCGRNILFVFRLFISPAHVSSPVSLRFLLFHEVTESEL